VIDERERKKKIGLKRSKGVDEMVGMDDDNEKGSWKRERKIGGMLK